jgi:hypothetical protein
VDELAAANFAQAGTKCAHFLFVCRLRILRMGML